MACDDMPQDSDYLLMPRWLTASRHVYTQHVAAVLVYGLPFMYKQAAAVSDSTAVEQSVGK